MAAAHAAWIRRTDGEPRLNKELCGRSSAAFLDHIVYDEIATVVSQ
jgi:hypothetical protein